MKVAIKQRLNRGEDTKHFSAYGIAEAPGRRDEPLKVHASTTGNVDHGVRACAAKAFCQRQGIALPSSAREVSALVNELIPHIALKALGGRVWIAELPECFDIGLLCPPQPAARGV